MATTTNYSWTTPDDTALVKDGAAAIRSLGTAIDTTVFNNAGAAIPKTIVDAKGDIIVATAADTVARLAVGGTNGHVLQVDSSTASGLKWDGLAAGGMTLINTGGTSLTGTSTTISSIPGTYNHLQVVIYDYKPTTDTDNLNMRFNANTTTYRSVIAINDTNNVQMNETYIRVSGESDNAVSDSMIYINIPFYSGTVSPKIGTAQAVTTSASTPSTSYNFYWSTWGFKDTGAITDLVFYNYYGGNLTGGTVYVYGVK